MTFMTTIVKQNEKIRKMEEEIKKLRNAFQDYAKCQQIVVEARELKNIIKEHDDKIKAVEETENILRTVM